MKDGFSLLFLGTCAAEFSPRLNTDLRDRFDLDVRRTSALLFDERYLIDCGVHLFDELRISGSDPGKITDLFLTHLHSDHFQPDHVRALAEGRERPLRVWVREDAEFPEIPGIELRRMKPLCEYDAGDGLSVTGLPANHDPKAFPQFLLFRRGGKKFLYATDGAWFLNESFLALRADALDLLILDGTCGDYAGDFRMGEHNSIPMIRLMLPSLLTVGAIKKETLVYITHLAPSLHLPHKETVSLLEKDGIRVAYDGLRLEI